TLYTHATWASSKTRPLSAAYASSPPCQSRWWGATLSTAPASGEVVCVKWSWKLDSSTARTSSVGSSTASTTGVPTLPTAAARSPPVRRIVSSISTVVVLTLVPVTASHGAGRPAGPSTRRRQASSTSLHTGTPRSP